MSSLVSLRVLCAQREETRDIKVLGTSSVSSLETLLSKLFDCGSSGWGIYQTCPSGSNFTGERWLSGRKSLDWYLPLQGTLEWKERGRVAEVELLNGNRTRVRIDDSHNVAKIIQTLGDKLGLSASSLWEYGIKFAGKLNAGLTDSENALTSGWLDVNKTLQEHGVKSGSKLELRWLKRWFAHDYEQVTGDDEVGLHYSFLEWKGFFLSDVLDTTSTNSADMARAVACLLHVDNGKFDKKKHTQQWYQGRKYVPDSWLDVLSFSAISNSWKALPDDVLPKKMFMEICRKLPGFGCTFFEASMAPAFQKVVVGLSKEKLTVYNPWKQGRMGAAASRERRLSRSLGLSPRGSPLDDDAPSTPTSGQAPSVLNTSSGKIVGKSASSASLARRNSGKKKVAVTSLDFNEDGETPTTPPPASAAGAGGPSPSSSLSSGSLPVVSPSPTPEEDPSRSKSPRALLARTFTTLRRDKKGSNANLNDRKSSMGPGSPGVLSSSSSQSDLTKSGRFKTFTGLRDLNPLKAKKQDSDSIIESPTTSTSGGLSPTSPAASTLDPAMDLSVDEFLRPEGRQELRAVNLEDISRWGINGSIVLLDIGAIDRHDCLEFNMGTSDVAKDFCELLRGYCAFRLDECPAIVQLMANKENASSMVHAAVSYDFRPVSLQLIGELYQRVKMVLSRSALQGSQKDARSLHELAEVLLASNNSLVASKFAGQVAQMAESSVDGSELRTALDSLACGIRSVFSDPDDMVIDEQTPVAVLECLRSRLLSALLFYSALTNGCRHCSVDSKVLEKIVDDLLGALEELTRRSSSTDVYLKVAQQIKLAAPTLLSKSRALLSLTGKDPVALDALHACANLSLECLSDLLTSCEPILDNLIGNGSASDGLVRQLWDAEQTLRSVKEYPNSFPKALVPVFNAFRDVVKSSSWDDASQETEALLKSINSAASAFLSAANSAKPSGRKGPVNTASDASNWQSRNRAVLLLLSDLLPLVVTFLSDLHHRHVYGAQQQGMTASMSSCRLVVEGKIERAMLVLLEGTLWQKSRTLVSKLEEQIMLFSIGVDAKNAFDSRRAGVEWEDHWKAQTSDISNSLKSYKNNVRSFSLPASQVVPLSVAEGWTAGLCEILDTVRELVRPFFVPDASPWYRNAATNIARCFQVLAADIARLINEVASVDWSEPSALAELQNLVSRDCDSCVTALNFHNPALATLRGNQGWLSSTDSATGSGWMRRGEISSQGAALKVKLIKKKATAEKSAFLTNRRKPDNPPKSPTTTALSSSVQSTESLSPSTPPTSKPSPFGASGGLLRTSASRRRASGEWEDE